LWKLLTAVSLIAWYLPVISFRNNKKYLPYFMVNSLVDPIGIALRYTFHIGMYNYIPIALFFEAMTMPIIDAKSRTVSAVILLLVAFTTGTNGYLELIICESVLALMVYYLLKDSFLEIKNDSAFKIFHLLLLIYFLRNGIMFFLYYIHQHVLINYYTAFLITTIILPVLIAYFGSEKKISINKRIIELLPFVKEYKIELAGWEFLYKKNGNGLSEREYEVIYEIIYHVSKGLTSNEIAEELHLSKKSVDHYRMVIKEKLGVSKRAEYIKFLEKLPPPHVLKNRR